MADTDAYALQNSDLNRFLYADIGIEASGMTLSVLSILARRGLDPWQEAARLARMPPVAATDGLATMIATIPAGLWSAPDAAQIAARLVRLLPGRGEAVPPVAGRRPEQPFDRWRSLLRGRAKSSRTFGKAASGANRGWLLVALLALLLAGLTLGLPHHRQAPAAAIQAPIAHAGALPSR